VVAKLIQLFGVLDPQRFLEAGIEGAFAAQTGATEGAARRGR